MTIFGVKSPIDRFGGQKPKATKLKPGRLEQLAERMGPLLETKSILDKVYSNGYFENYYPDADKLLKDTLHERAMQAWAKAKDDSPAMEEVGLKKKGKKGSLEHYIQKDDNRVFNMEDRSVKEGDTKIIRQGDRVVRQGDQVERSKFKEGVTINIQL